MLNSVNAFSRPMDNFSREEFFLKLKEEQEQKEKQPLSFFSMNNIIFEDNPNKTIKIYDKTLFV